jgi:hypothetical protein
MVSTEENHPMKMLFVLTAALLCLVASPALAAVVISDDFESYPDTSEMHGVWANELAGTLDETTLATDLGNPGKSGFNPGTDSTTQKNLSEFTFAPILPAAEEWIRVRADIYDDATSANERQTLGLRSNNPSNILEMGHYNSILDRFFLYRVQLFDGESPDWQAFSLPEDLDSPAEVGPGWHRYEAIIKPDAIELTLDLYSDGTIDATDVVSVAPQASGFDSIRWGGPSGLWSAGSPNADPPEPGSASFDNILLELFTPGDELLGDVNRDEDVNGLDVDPFVDVLLNGPYQAEADMNEDQEVNGLDVDPFVAAVVGGGVQQVPEPATYVLAMVGVLLLLGTRLRQR